MVYEDFASLDKKKRRIFFIKNTQREGEYYILLSCYEILPNLFYSWI